MVTKIYLVTTEVCANAKSAMNYSALFIYTLSHRADVRFRGIKQGKTMFQYLIVTFNNESEGNEFDKQVNDVTGVYKVTDVLENACTVMKDDNNE